MTEQNEQSIPPNSHRAPEKKNGCACGKPKNHCDPCSTDSRTSEEKYCRESITRDGWHFMLCKKPAKYSVTLPHASGPIYRCGIHARRFKKHSDVKVKAL